MAVATRDELTTEDRCLNWLSYGADARQPELPVKIACYDEGSRASENIGIYVIPLRAAQMFWAARKLAPFYRDTAFAVRRLPNREAVIYFAATTHPAEWEAWRGEWRFRPIEKLRRHIAELMAQRLGDDLL